MKWFLIISASIMAILLLLFGDISKFFTIEFAGGVAICLLWYRFGRVGGDGGGDGGVPNYQFTALDSSGQQTTGQFAAENSEAASERVKAMGLFATEISELTDESRIGEPIGLLARLNDAFMWMLFGVVLPYVCIRIAWQVPEQLEGKQWFIVPILGGLSLYNVWHRLKKGEWIKPGG